MTKNVLSAIQIFVSIILIVLILLQNSSENSGATSLIKPKFTRRGLEKATFLATIILLSVFIFLSFAQLFL